MRGRGFVATTVVMLLLSGCGVLPGPSELLRGCYAGRPATVPHQVVIGPVKGAKARYPAELHDPQLVEQDAPLRVVLEVANGQG